MGNSGSVTVLVSLYGEPQKLMLRTYDEAREMVRTLTDNGYTAALEVNPNFDPNDHQHPGFDSQETHWHCHRCNIYSIEY